MSPSLNSLMIKLVPSRWWNIYIYIYISIDHVLSLSLFDFFFCVFVAFDSSSVLKHVIKREIRQYLATLNKQAWSNGTHHIYAASGNKAQNILFVQVLRFLSDHLDFLQIKLKGKTQDNSQSRWPAVTYCLNLPAETFIACI